MNKEELKAGVSKVIHSLPASVVEMAKSLRNKTAESSELHRETVREKRLHRRMKNRKGETATAEYDEHLPKALKSYLKSNPAVGTEHTEVESETGEVEASNKTMADSGLASLELFGPTFAKNLLAIANENGLSADEFSELFADFSGLSTETVKGWFAAERLPIPRELKLLAVFCGFREDKKRFLSGIFLANFLPTYRRYLDCEGIPRTHRRGVTLQELVNERRVALSAHDRGILLSVAESLQTSSPMEIAERLVSQQKQIAELKENTDLLATSFVEDRQRLNDVIEFLNRRTQQLRRLLCASAVLGLIAVGTIVAWQTGGISNSATSVPAASSVAH